MVKMSRLAAFVLGLLMSAACGNGTQGNGGNPVAHIVGGTVSGAGREGLVLQNNGSDELIIPANGSTFAFPTGIAEGGSYSVTVKYQPAMEGCFVSRGSGTVSNADVTDIAVACSTVLRYR